MKKEAVLQQIANRLRHHVLRMTTKAGSGHPTTCLSMAELMACLFFDELRYDPKNPNNSNNDEFVLSKGHASPILWAAYAEAGVIPQKSLETYRQYGSILEGHPTPRMPWVKASTGSLGQGLSIGLGMALGVRLQEVSSRIFVILGDGECAEGSIWEAAALASKYSVSNLVAIVDCNRLGQSGESLHGYDFGKWAEKFVAFGWKTFTINGHSVSEILAAFEKIRDAKSPTVILAKTVKGKGVSFLENKEGWHGKVLKLDELRKALSELGSMPQVDASKLVKVPGTGRFMKRSSLRCMPPNYKQGELIATREAYGSALQKLGCNEHVVALDGDVKNSTFAEKFKRVFPDRFFDCFIAEQNMVGMAAGLAARGFIPVVSTFAAFMSRAHDQLRMSAISNANVKCCGSHVGVSIGEDGPSQMGLEDIALFRSLPNSIVLYPADAVATEKCTALLASSEGVGYLRTSRPRTQVIYKNSESFKIGRSKILRKNKNSKVLIIAAGITLHEALKAALILEKKKIFVDLIDAYSVKPLDKKTILSMAKGKRVIVVEDHYPEGGLGEAIAVLGIPITHLAVKTIPRSGASEKLLKEYKLDASAIINCVKFNVSK